MELTKPVTGIAGAGLLAVGLLAGCGASDDQGGDGSATPAAAGDVSQASTDAAQRVDDMPAEDADLREVQFPVAPEEAIVTATDETGDGTVHAIELDYDSDTDSWLYNVKVLTEASGADHDDHKVLIDPVSGDVVDQESESTSDAEETIDLDDPMTYDEGLDKATAEVDGPLRGWKYEWDDGQLEYQFDLADVDETTEVTVLAETADVGTD